MLYFIHVIKTKRSLNRIVRKGDRFRSEGEDHKSRPKIKRIHKYYDAEIRFYAQLALRGPHRATFSPPA